MYSSITDIESLLFLIAFSAIFFQLVYRVFSPIFSSKIIPGYSTLTDSQKIRWNCGSCSIINGILVCTFSSLAFLEGKIQTNKIWAYSDFSLLNACVGMGYFLSDIQIMGTHFHDSGASRELIIHHLTSTMCYLVTTIYGVLGYFATLRSFQELSQPSLQIRWCLSTLKKKTTKFYFWNGMFLTTSFFVSRLCVIPIYYYYTFQSYVTEDYTRLPLIAKIIWIPSSVSMDILNIYWFTLLLRGLVRHLTNKPAKDD